MPAVTGPPCLLWSARAKLGEGPLWDDAAERAYWLDIEGRWLHRVDISGQERRSWRMPERIGFAALTTTPGLLLLGLQSGLHLFRAGPDEETSSLALQLVARPDGGGAETRPNDGMVDATGRLWFGTMHIGEREGAGAIHLFEPGRGCRRLAQGWTIPNGPVVTPDAARLFWADSHRRSVFVFDIEPDGTLRNQRPFLIFGDDEPGVPDGMVGDAEGCLWVAHNGGGCVVRYDTAARPLERLDLPAAQVSSCTFAGEGLRTLLVTTARQGADAAQEYDAAGALFAVPTRIRGIAPGRLRLG